MATGKRVTFTFTVLLLAMFSIKAVYAEDNKTADASPAVAAASARLEIKGKLKATCSLTAPSSVEMGKIPISAIEKEEGKKGLGDYAKTFNITISCAGAEKYVLEFKADKVTSEGCLETVSQALAFCLYSKDKKLDLSRPGSSQLTGNISTKSEVIKVLPSQGSKRPVAGTHSGGATLTIKPQ